MSGQAVSFSSLVSQSRVSGVSMCAVKYYEASSNGQSCLHAKLLHRSASQAVCTVQRKPLGSTWLCGCPIGQVCWRQIGELQAGCDCQAGRRGLLQHRRVCRTQHLHRAPLLLGGLCVTVIVRHDASLQVQPRLTHYS